MLSPIADTYVDSDNATAVYGRDVFLISRFDSKTDRKSQPFLKFDLSLVPPGSTINEATLKLYLKDTMTNLMRGYRPLIEMEFKLV